MLPITRSFIQQKTGKMPADENEAAQWAAEFQAHLEKWQSKLNRPYDRFLTVAATMQVVKVFPVLGPHLCGQCSLITK